MWYGKRLLKWFCRYIGDAYPIKCSSSVLLKS